MINESIRKVINVDRPNYSPVWNFKQEDDGVLRLSLFKGSTSLDITGQTVKLGVLRADKTLVELEEQVNFTINKNELDITLKNNILSIPGIAECDLTLTDASGKMTTASFFIEVKKKTTGLANILGANLIEGLEKLKNDFKATGDKLISAFSKEYDSLKRIIIDENQAANLQDQVNQTNAQLETNTSELNNVKTDYAKKTDLNSKAEVSLVNDINAKVSNMTSNNPSGVYANLQALKTAKPSGENKVYITSDNGHWNYWNGSDWVSGGTFQTPIREEKHNLSCTIIPSIDGYPDYNTQTKIFDFKSTSGRDVVLLYDNTNYVIPANTTVTNTQGSSAVKLTFDRNTKAFNFRAFNYIIPENEILVFSMRKVNDSKVVPCSVFPVSLNGTFDYLLNGITLTKSMFPDKIIESAMQTDIGTSVTIALPYSCEPPNLDTNANTLTFYKDTIVIYGKNAYALPNDVVLNLSGGSSVKKIWFDTNNNTINIGSFNQVIGESCMVFAGFRYLSATKQSLSLMCDYTVNGNPRFQPFGTALSSKICPLNANIKAIAHRGFSSQAPENTLPAFKLAKEKGFSYVEVDISWTSDNIPVCLHDDTVDRTSDGTGNITDLTLEQVKTLDFGSWKDVKYTGTRIPTFEEFLIYCKKLNLHAYIEFKGTLTDEQTTIITDIVRNNAMKGKCSYIGFKLENLQKLVAKDDKTRIGYLTGRVDTTSITQAKTLKTENNEVFLDSENSTILKENVVLSLKEDIEVEAYTINAENMLDGLVEKGISGITTDTLNLEEIFNN